MENLFVSGYNNFNTVFCAQDIPFVGIKMLGDCGGLGKNEKAREKSAVKLS